MCWPHLQGQTAPKKSHDQEEGEETDEPEEVSAHKEWCQAGTQKREKDRENVCGREH